MKLAILGYSGSGKSTLARFISEKRNLPLLHLDAVNFVQDWQERDKEEARTIVRDFLTKEDWLIEGNYNNFLQQERLKQADQIYILTFSRWTSLRRILARGINYRGKVRPDMAAGCIEKVDAAFLWWVLYEGRTAEKRNHFTAIKNQYPTKTILIKNQRQLDKIYQQFQSK
ncbi:MULTISPECIES: DNA topology modulation protein FlaR [Enterococcus]|uniref:DNA topology modulation protein FlaR n=1 Tax=Enterococcus TaxID=1350 RepID=UPI0010F4D11C|nr:MULTISPECIES: DNA topology modulation protein FlaR [Enterococcus]KAF1302339.1 DNA topology modulation protein FlaR [Enterococcus sp. JM9B]